MKFITEGVAKWQIERLESLIRHFRSRAKANRLKSSSIVCEHLNHADENLDEAIAAMKYHRYDQASFACQSGFMQLGLAELLLQHGAKIDAGVRALSSLNPQKPAKEDEELTAYLASCLADMKIAIEYSNCKVSIRAHSVLDQAMDYYNDSLKAIKKSNEERNKLCAQSGLLCMLLASELIAAENQMPLPGWRGLSNPTLFGPLRRARELVVHLAETRQRLHQREQPSQKESLDNEEKEKVAFLRKNWEKAYGDFLLAVHSHSEGTVSHAQALLKSAIRGMETCRDIIGIEDPEQFEEELEEAEDGRRAPSVDVAAEVNTIRNILEERKFQRKEHILLSLERIHKLYKDGLRNFDKGHFVRAEKAIGEAMLELDLIRQQIYARKQKYTNTHKT